MNFIITINKSPFYTNFINYSLGNKSVIRHEDHSKKQKTNKKKSLKECKCNYIGFNYTVDLTGFINC